MFGSLVKDVATEACVNPFLDKKSEVERNPLLQEQFSLPLFLEKIFQLKTVRHQFEDVASFTTVN